MVRDVLITVIRWTEKECKEKNRSQEYIVSLEQLRAACLAIMPFL